MNDLGKGERAVKTGIVAGKWHFPSMALPRSYFNIYGQMQNIVLSFFTKKTRRALCKYTNFCKILNQAIYSINSHKTV